MFKIYVSGPITADTLELEEENVDRAMLAADRLFQLGHAVYLPHTSWYIDKYRMAVGKKPHGRDFLPMDKEWVKACDAVYRMPGQSIGADLEVEWAESASVPVFRSFGAIDRHFKEILADQSTVAESKIATKEDTDIFDYKFMAILKDIEEMHNRKGKDYGSNEDPLANCRGSEDYGIPAWIGVQIRLDDKRTRIKKAICELLETGRFTMANESLKDSLLDRCVYSIIALQLFRETDETKKKTEVRYLV